MDSQEIKKPLPVSISIFDMVIEEGAYYVDKTLFIKDLLDKRMGIMLCTRPRRFGKTLNQTMLKCFFEDTTEVGGQDTRALFKGLKIESAGEQYMQHQGKYPVIFLSFKEAKLNSFESSFYKLISEIAEEFRRHRYASNNTSEKDDLEQFERIASLKGSVDDYSEALKLLCKFLFQYHGKKAIILIDEYDVPLENAWSQGFYNKMVNFIRPLFSSACKDNPYLQFAVITGCLRISKESIFTGLNNLDVISILSESYDEYFGFTQEEIDVMLQYYGIETKRDILKEWYNGYLFGNAEVYNPWSTILAIRNWHIYIDKLPMPYWVNTSSNDIVRKLIDRADSEMKIDLETLIAGGTITKAIHEDITYDEIDQDARHLWNFLFFTGYLKKTGNGYLNDDDQLMLELTIPNVELRYIYKNKIQEWFRDTIKAKNLEVFYDAILSGNVEVFQNELSNLLSASISFMDSVENFYHGFMAGILSRLNNYLVKSNRESGNGRSDLVLYGVNNLGKAVIFELKPAKKFKDMPDECDEALKQIEDNNYAAYWQDEGYANILKYGIAFYKKSCFIKKG